MSGEFNFFGSNNFDKYTQELFENLITATKTSNEFPDSQNYSYYTTYGPFKSRMNNFGQRLLDLTQGFLQLEKGNKAPIINDLEDAEDLLEQFEAVTDVVDSIIEKVDTFADAAKGEVSKPTTIVMNTTKPPPAFPKSESYYMFHTHNIPRPQLKFADEIDNSNKLWVPRLVEKPNAIKPWDPHHIQQLHKTLEDQPTDVRLKMQEVGYPHPYEYEISTLVYLPKQLQPCKEQPYLLLQSTPLTWVDTLPALEALVVKLNHEPEFAVDLENHNYRSFQGFVCLMQLSTRTEDFIVDALALRSKMHLLNLPFTNPRIVKVLHGSDSDIVWLQRDFGLYIVNLFDTGQASRVLEYPKFSLAFLLSKFCNVTADKQYQLADWRIRPIPAEMLKYAQEDTHYLLYIYDCMKNELITRGNQTNNLLLAVWNRSKELCLKKYEKELFTATSHLVLYNKYNLVFTPQQMRVFAALYAWRDRTAREQDESTRYVLPNHMLFRISEAMPSDGPTLLSCCNPVPPLLKQYITQVINVINEAKKEKGKPGAESKEVKADTAKSLPFSPVLTSEQLYTTAGWVDDTTPRESRFTVQFSTLNEGLNSSSPLPTSLLFDSSSDDEDTNEAKKTVSLIQESFAESIFPQVTEPAVVQQPDKSKAKDTVTEPESTSPLPQSMAEIYKLSNQIKRKRNKEKKKLKQEQTQNDQGESSDDEDTNKSKKQKGTEKSGESIDNPEQFMRDIGWVPPPQHHQDSTEQQHPSHYTKPQREKRKEGSSLQQFVPFDYNSAQQQPTNPGNRSSSAQAAYFNPYGQQAPQGKRSGNNYKPKRSFEKRK